MNRAEYKKFVVSKLVDLIKFCFTLGLLCFLVVKAPSELSQIVSAAAAFVLGGSKLKSKLGFD